MVNKLSEFIKKITPIRIVYLLIVMAVCATYIVDYFMVDVVIMFSMARHIANIILIPLGILVCFKFMKQNNRWQGNALIFSLLPTLTIFNWFAIDYLYIDYLYNTTYGDMLMYSIVVIRLLLNAYLIVHAFLPKKKILKEEIITIKEAIY